MLDRCAVAAARIGQPGSTPRTPALHVAFSAMLSAVTGVQICLGAGMVYTAAGGSRVGRPMVVVSRQFGPLLRSAREEERG